MSSEHKDQPKISVIAIDDHKAILHGLSLLLEHEDDILLCATALDCVSALESIKNLTVNVIVLDISLQQANGLELLKDIKIQYPDIEVLVFSMHNEMVYAERAIQAGALGYIMKDESLDKVIEGIRTVHRKELFVSSKIKEQLLRKSIGQTSTSDSMSVSKLSDRELEVFTLIGEGKRPRHIAEQLNMSPKTVASYCSRIRDKMSIENMDELISIASEWVKT